MPFTIIKVSAQSQLWFESTNVNDFQDQNAVR